MDLKWFYFSFKGRIGRKQFWLYGVLLFMLFYMAALIPLMAVQYALGAEPPGAYVGYALFAVVYVIMVWASLAVYVKRVHDRNRSGWFLLIQLIPIVGAIWLIVEAGFLKGTEGPNRFGPDPLAGTPGMPSAPARTVTTA
ncbi:MAG: DUF805 domain-containing protein [Pseudomonadota bacterium]|nr:DUF805 domain-containing protein [Pseudomonadota bacterium]